jgi:hypothetical protein
VVVLAMCKAIVITNGIRNSFLRASSVVMRRNTPSVWGLVRTIVLHHIQCHVCHFCVVAMEVSHDNRFLVQFTVLDYYYDYSRHLNAEFIVGGNHYRVVAVRIGNSFVFLVMVWL